MWYTVEVDRQEKEPGGVNVNWASISLDKSDDMKLSGYRSRAYICNTPFYLELGRSKRVRMFLGAIVHSKRDDILVEIFHRKETTRCRLVASDILDRFFNEMNVMTRAHFFQTANETSAKIVFIDNKVDGRRACIRLDCKNPLVSGPGKNVEEKRLRKDTITYSIVGDIVEDYGELLLLMVSFPRKIVHVDDAKNVCQAMLNIRHDGPSIWSHYFEREVEAQRRRIEEYKISLENREDGFVRICEESASALDELSQRFGIEIDMSMDETQCKGN